MSTWLLFINSLIVLGMFVATHDQEPKPVTREQRNEVVLIALFIQLTCVVIDWCIL